MFSPIAPLFASECWSKFCSVPHRIDASEKTLNWSNDVLEQQWPMIDKNIDDVLVIKVSAQNKAYFISKIHNMSLAVPI